MQLRNKSKMGAPVKYPLAKERVFQILARDGDEISAEVINAELPPLDKAGSPVTRMVSVWKKEWMEKDSDSRAPYRFYSWPDSHRTKALPPEAAPIALELQRIYAKSEIKGPTLRQVEYAYWLRLADPEMPFYIDPSEDGNLWCIWEVSRTLAAHERSDGAGIIWSVTADEEGRISYAEVVNDMLMCRPWASDRAGRHYLQFNEYRKRGPMAIHVWGNVAAPVGVLEELGWSKEDIAKSLAMEQAIFQSTGNESERMFARVIASVDTEKAAKKEDPTELFMGNVQGFHVRATGHNPISEEATDGDEAQT